MEKQYAIYIMTNYLNTTFYIGVTNNLLRRVIEHKKKVNDGFTSKYNLNKLVYFEEWPNIMSAIQREKTIKRLTRNRKIMLIEKLNPYWKELM